MPRITCHTYAGYVAVLNHDTRRLLAIMDGDDGYQIPVLANKGELSDSEPLRRLTGLRKYDSDRQLLEMAYVVIYTRWPECK